MHSDFNIKGFAQPRSSSVFGSIRRALAELLYPEWREQRNVLTRAAEVDHLTGLANRRALDRALDATESDARLAVCMFDVNNFGMVNKLLSHVAGDEMLKGIACHLRETARAYGYAERCFRCGGDEFVCIVPAEIAATVCADVALSFGTCMVGGWVQSVEVSITGAVGQTFAEAAKNLQQRKAARRSQHQLEMIGER